MRIRDLREAISPAAALVQFTSEYPTMDVDGTGEDFRNMDLDYYRGQTDPNATEVPEEFIRYVFADTMRRLTPMMRQAQIPIYREIVVEKEEDVNMSNLGLSWSWHPRGAIAHGGPLQGTEMTVKGRVPTSDIDWMATIWLNQFIENEMEIRLKPDARVTVVDVRRS